MLCGTVLGCLLLTDTIIVSLPLLFFTFIDYSLDGNQIGDEGAQELCLFAKLPSDPLVCCSAICVDVLVALSSDSSHCSDFTKKLY